MTKQAYMLVFFVSLNRYCFIKVSIAEIMHYAIYAYTYMYQF